MSRPTLVYIVMLLACGAGLWAILRGGSGLRAPTDLSGAWNVGGEDPKVPEVLGQTVTIEQSGRFFRLNFERGLRVDVKLTDETPTDGTAGRLLDMVFEGPRWSLSTRGTSANGPLIFRLTGPERHTFTATRHGRPARGGTGGRDRLHPGGNDGDEDDESAGAGDTRPALPASPADPVDPVPAAAAAATAAAATAAHADAP